jgi:hypothetical protein
VILPTFTTPRVVKLPMKGLEHLHDVRQRQLRKPEHMPASEFFGVFTLLGLIALCLVSAIDG